MNARAAAAGLALLVASCGTPVDDRSAGQEEPLALVERLMEGHSDRDEEARIIAVFREASPQALNRLVLGLDMEALIADVDQRVLGPDHREAFLALLARERLAELGIAARARLVDALQRGRTDALDSCAVRDIFTGTRGAALTELKNRIDAGGDEQDLHKLVFHDVDDDAIRAELLAHIAREAKDRHTGEVKVLSDVDDTFYSSLNDERYPGGVVYPGVLALYRELDLGGSAKAEREGDLVFLTARPGDRAGWVEGHTHRMLRERGVGEATVLAGDLASLRSHEAMAAGKLENLAGFRRLYPEYDLVFLGDSGQGDVLLGLAMRERFPDAVRAVLIHDVAGTPAPEREELGRRGVTLVDTYVGAALEAHRLRLITGRGLRRVAGEAERALARVPFADDEQRQRCAALFARDLARARATLQE